MKKKIGYSLLALLVIAISLGAIGIRKFHQTYFKDRPAYVEFEHQEMPIQFKWANNKFNDHIERQTAMLVPVQIGDLKYQLNMQFDTGAPDSFFYEKGLESLRKLGVEIDQVTKDGFRFVKSLELILGGMPVKLDMVKIYPNYGTTFSQTNEPKGNILIGTLGSDILVNRITAIDFKNQTLQFFENSPEWMTNSSGFHPFDFPGRRIMLPVQIDGKEYEFLYDSGCSAFGLITTKNRFERYTDEASPLISYAAKSWTDKIDINTKISNHPFMIGGAKLTLNRVSFVNMYSFVQPLMTPFTRIEGWMGNQALNQSTLIIDTKTKRFKVIPG
ncbi:MAG: hypothetical protein CMB99_04040 [Flavobacteriaceae bacterium]|nr:hypothetical protein [Flavobacteriaceae bacterium]|tara:strand:- start:38377 stop:39366 length:990 start_codon:yes stop_codon:yes gene_type:complete